MDFFEVVAKRHSIREYQEKSVEKEKLDQILEAANVAPSAGNLQAYEIFVIKDENKKRVIAQMANQQDFIAKAPMVLIFCAHPELSSGKYGERGEKLYSLQDATIAASYAQLAATALGLGTCWVGAFNEGGVLSVLGDPPGLIPMAIMPIGYPAEKPEIRQRRELNDIVHQF